MIPFIDVNLWLYLANASSPFYAKVKQALTPYLRGDKNFVLSWQVFYEFIRTATDPRVYVSPLSWNQAFDYISRVFQMTNARLLHEGNTHSEALQFVLEQSGYSRGHFIHDCHIAALLYENGIKTILSADNDFRRFPFLEVIDPTS